MSWHHAIKRLEWTTALAAKGAKGAQGTNAPDLTILTGVGAPSGKSWIHHWI